MESLEPHGLARGPCSRCRLLSPRDSVPLLSLSARRVLPYQQFLKAQGLGVREQRWQSAGV